MTAKDFGITFVIASAATFVANAVVIYLYNLLVHGAGAFDWGMSFRLGFTFGFVMAYLNYRQEKSRSDGDSG